MNDLKTLSGHIVVKRLPIPVARPSLQHLVLPSGHPGSTLRKFGDRTVTGVSKFCSRKPFYHVVFKFFQVISFLQYALICWGCHVSFFGGSNIFVLFLVFSLLKRILVISYELPWPKNHVHTEKWFPSRHFEYLCLCVYVGSGGSSIQQPTYVTSAFGSLW